MIPQDVFNKAVRGVINQGKPAGYRDNAVTGGFRCQYRDQQGRACAVGMLLDDETGRKAEDMGIGGVEDLVKEHLLPEDLVPHLNLLVDLQQAHDNAADHLDTFVETFTHKAGDVARRHNLEMPQ